MKLILILICLVINTAQAAPVLIKNAKLAQAGLDTDVLVDILVQDGRFQQVETNLQLPGAVSETLEIIDAQGQWVTPGLIDSGTTIGLVDVPGLGVSSDNQVEDFSLSAGFSVALALNPESSLIRMAPTDGITRAVIIPAPGNSNYAGQSSVVEFSGKTDFVVYADNAVHLYLRERDRRFAGGSRAAVLYAAVLGLQESQRYSDNRRAFEANKLRPFSLEEADLKALARVVSGELVLAIHVDRAADIRSALAALAEFENIRPVLMGATEAWKIADDLAAGNIPVVINVLANTPSNFDKLGARLDNAAMLTEAGVRVAFMSSSPFSEFRSLTQAAGVAVANGLSFKHALQAITSNPAEIWGLESLGMIESGGIADLVIWDGDPLELMSAPVKTMINGNWVEFNTRQSLLAKRYLSISRGKPVDSRSTALRKK